jgi:tripartite-type tricarboxylate transporter receptor subunit TctC
MTDLVGGNIDLYRSAVPTLLGQVRNGKLRPIVVTSLKRSAQLPDTPTLAESGYKDFEAISWYGVLAPAGTPDAIVQQLNKAINEALKQPDEAEKLRSEGGDVLGGTSQKFDQLLRAEVPRWSKIVKDSGASLD